MIPKQYYISLDTETANGLDCPLVYDIGFAVIDIRGNIYEQYSYVIYDIFFERKDLMDTAYYKEKIPNYINDINNGKRKIARFLTIRKKIVELIKKYNITAVMAHNARFDLNALNNTLRYLTKSKMRYFFPYGTQIWDTLAMARSTIGKQKTYKLWCKMNNYLTKNGRPKLTAEILYRYISFNDDFIESHTGLEDVLIEICIFVKCVNQHKKMQRTYYRTA